MLRNPWIQPPPGVTAEPLEVDSLPDSLLDFARRKLGSSFQPGFGYISAVLIGPRSVIKFDRFPGRTGRFGHDRAVSGFEIDGIAVPRLLDEGVCDAYEWIEQSIVPGVPAFVRWNDLDERRHREFMAALAAAIRQMQEWPVERSLLHSRYSDWSEHVSSAVQRSIENAVGIVDEAVLAGARNRFDEWIPQIASNERATCHGDLWFGNVFVDDTGRLTGIIDWDRLAVAPKVYELDMVWRFWRFPWNFVPEDWEARYARPLPAELLAPVVESCVDPGQESFAIVTLSMLELAYRLGMARRFGWSDELRGMLDLVLEGRWTEGLGLA